MQNACHYKFLQSRPVGRRLRDLDRNTQKTSGPKTFQSFSRPPDAALAAAGCARVRISPNPCSGIPPCGRRRPTAADPPADIRPKRRRGHRTLRGESPPLSRQLPLLWLRPQHGAHPPVTSARNGIARPSGTRRSHRQAACRRRGSDGRRCRCDGPCPENG